MYFCYLLKYQNEKHKNDTYIGFTDNPIKRLKQHNGNIKGGAKKTSKKRPWTLVIVISNFPNKILALKFEWAWTNPFISNFTAEKLKSFDFPSILVKNKNKYYQSVEFKLKVLNVLVNSKIYEKISLYVHSFEQDVINYKLIEPNNQHIMEFVDEASFKECVKNKIYFYSENIEDNTFSSFNNIESILDKCLICSENLLDSVADKLNAKNDAISSEDDLELNYNLSSISVKNDLNVKAIPQEENINTLDNLAKCPYCKSQFHLICLAQSTLEKQNLINYSLIPKVSDCLICGRNYNWSEFLK